MVSLRRKARQSFVAWRIAQGIGTSLRWKARPFSRPVRLGGGTNPQIRAFYARTRPISCYNHVRYRNGVSHAP
jgi:hypothetical protein